MKKLQLCFNNSSNPSTCLSQTVPLLPATAICFPSPLQLTLTTFPSKSNCADPRPHHPPHPSTLPPPDSPVSSTYSNLLSVSTPTDTNNILLKFKLSNLPP